MEWQIQAFLFFQNMNSDTRLSLACMYACTHESNECVCENVYAHGEQALVSQKKYVLKQKKLKCLQIHFFCGFRNINLCLKMYLKKSKQLLDFSFFVEKN
jgi:hypothetical protein